MKNKLTKTILPTIKDWVIGLLLFLVALTSSFTGEISIRHLNPTHIIIYSVLAVLAISVLRIQSEKATQGIKNVAIVIAILFSQFTTIGQSIFYLHDWTLCFGGWKNILIWIIQSSFYAFVYYKIVLGILCAINYSTHKSQSCRINHRKAFILAISIRLLYFIAFYPCVFGFDAAVGLRTLLDSNCATCNHHPYFIQLLHGTCFQLGFLLGHKSLGFAFLSLLLILISAAIINYGIKLHELAGTARKPLIIITLIYSILPIFPYLSVYPTKDGIFAYFFLLYSYTLYEIYLTKGYCFSQLKFLILHGVSILLVCLTRHQGLYIIILEFICLVLCYKKYWIKILLSSVPSLLLVLGFTKILMPIFQVEPAGKQEVYGTFFQQTALYLKKYPTEISSQERTSINAILDCDTIAARYTYNISDPVKNLYKYNPWYRVTPKSPSMFRHIDHKNEDKKLAEYRTTWISMFLRHPITYIEATTYVCSGFFFNMGQPLILTEPRWAENRNATTPEYIFWHVNKVAKFVDVYLKPLTQKPVLSWILGISYYMWLSLVLTAMLLYKRERKAIVVFLPFIISIMILVICPIAFGRYIFPIVMVLPLLFLHLLSNTTCQK